jgi:hypothetical protein
MTKPRLSIRTVTNAQGEPLERPVDNGDFADGPKGRQEARAALANCHSQMDFIATFAAEHRGSLGQPVIERRFTDGVQELFTLPHPNDFKPQTLAEARTESAAFMAWYEQSSRLSETARAQLGDFQHGGFAYPERVAVTDDEQAAVIGANRLRAERTLAQRIDETRAQRHEQNQNRGQGDAEGIAQPDFAKPEAFYGLGNQIGRKRGMGIGR